MLVSEITTTNWQISASGLGEIAQGTDDIAQCIGIILNTVPGSDVLRPDFGSSLFSYLDMPVNVAISGLKKALTFDVERWEPRVRVTNITANISDANTVSVTVVWQLLIGEVAGTSHYSFTFGATAHDQPPAISFSNPVTTSISRTLDWQLSLHDFGSTVEGQAEISQAISIAVSNMPGTDVLRPLFGSDVWQYIDDPLNSAGANMAQAIRYAVEIWEPRAEITRVAYEYQAQPGETMLAGLIFRIAWRLRGGDVEGQTDLLLQLLNEGTEYTAPVIIVRILAAETGELIQTEAGELIEAGV